MLSFIVWNNYTLQLHLPFVKNTLYSNSSLGAMLCILHTIEFILELLKHWTRKIIGIKPGTSWVAFKFILNRYKRSICWKSSFIKKFDLRWLTFVGSLHITILKVNSIYWLMKKKHCLVSKIKLSLIRGLDPQYFILDIEKDSDIWISWLAKMLWGWQWELLVKLKCGHHADHYMTKFLAYLGNTDDLL